jgi:hypothetical protein
MSRTLLGNPMPEMLATADDVLNQKLIGWLGGHPSRRIGKEDDGQYSDGSPCVTCVLIDRGVERRAHSKINWEDAVRNALTVVAWADFHEKKTGRILPVEGEF